MKGGKDKYCSRYRNLISRLSVVKKYELDWRSSCLSSVRACKSRVESIVCDVFEDKTEVFRDAEAYICSTKHAVENNESFWNMYFFSYDKVFGGSSEYEELVKLCTEFLLDGNAHCKEQNSSYLDAGGGTGNFSMEMLMLDEACKVFLIDMSSVGVNIARDKSSYIGKEAGARFEANTGDLRNLEDFVMPRLLDGIVMNNVLYSLHEDQRQEVLDSMFSSLKSGGRMFLSDPLPIVDENVQKKFICSAVLSALEAGMYVTETDIALVAFMNRRLMSRCPVFLSADSLKNMAKKSGFVVRRVEESRYYGFVTSLLLEKP